MVTASFTVTIYKYSLGAYDAVTGVPADQYTEATARVAVVPKGTARRFFGCGNIGQADMEGLTGANLHAGDIIYNTYGSTGYGYWRVMGRQVITWGNVFLAYLLDLAELQTLPFVKGTTTSMGGYDPAYYDENFYAHYVIVS